MRYQRPTISKPDGRHPLQESFFGALGQIKSDNDPAWLTPHLEPVMDMGHRALSKFQKAIDEVSRTDWSELKPEIARAKKNELILKARREALAVLKTPIEKYSSDANAASNEILRYTEVAKPKDASEAITLQLRQQEIRNLVRNMEQKNREAFVQGNLERIQALIDSPDEILSQEHLNKLRRDFAFSKDATLAEFEKDQRIVYQSVRRRVAEINATMITLLQINRLDDPLPPFEHFEVFPPESEHELFLANKRVQQWLRNVDAEERRKAFDEQHEGINLQAGERADRSSKGIQH